MAGKGEPSRSNELGTFGGVFTPSILTILGVIMFMRAGFVVGQAGIFQTLLTLLLAKNIILLEDKDLSHDSLRRRIDIWWRGEENGYLMTLTAHLLTLNWEWSRSRIRLLRLMKEEAAREPSRGALLELIRRARMDPEAEIIVSDDPLPEVLERYSGDASLVILGFKVPEEREQDAYRFQMHFDRILSGLPTTLLVCSSGEPDVLA